MSTKAKTHLQRTGFLAEITQQRQFLNIILVAFSLLLLFVPLPLGSNRMWAASLVSVWLNLLLFVLLATWMAQPKLIESPFTPAVRGAAAILLVVVAWIILQTSWLVPNDWQHPLWQEAQRLLINQGLLKNPPLQGSIVLDASATNFYLVRFLSYAASFWIALLLGQDGRRAHILLGVIIVAELLYASYGFAIEISGTNKVLWFDKRSYIDNMTSTFFNRNSYAAYAGLGLLSSCAYVFYRWRKVWRDSSMHFFWRDFLTTLASKEIYWLLLPVTMFTALVLSASRAGFASCMVGISVLILGLAINKHMPIIRVLAVVLGFIALGIGALMIGGNTLVERLNANMVNEDFEMRLGVYKLTWEAIKANPWLGYGLGNFDTAFRMFRDPTVVGWFQEAHNEYLEMMMDLGIPMAMLWLSAIGLLIWRCLHGMVKRRKDGIFPVLALAATTQEGLHSVLDFSLQIPAVAITYAALLGLGVAQSRSSRTNPND
jgi:O-antigen ligase